MIPNGSSKALKYTKVAGEKAFMSKRQMRIFIGILGICIFVFLLLFFARDRYYKTVALTIEDFYVYSGDTYEDVATRESGMYLVAEEDAVGLDVHTKRNIRLGASKGEVEQVYHGVARVTERTEEAGRTLYTTYVMTHGEYILGIETRGTLSIAGELVNEIAFFTQTAYEALPEDSKWK